LFARRHEEVEPHSEAAFPNSITAKLRLEYSDALRAQIKTPSCLRVNKKMPTAAVHTKAAESAETFVRTITLCSKELTNAPTKPISTSKPVLGKRHILAFSRA
jgi:hypothetical protein